MAAVLVLSVIRDYFLKSRDTRLSSHDHRGKSDAGMCRRSFTPILSDVTLEPAAAFTSLGALPGFGALL